MNRLQSEILFERAQKVIPGGVNSPVRAFSAVGGTPPFISKGAGAHIFDEDGNRLLDGVASMWCNVWGHSKRELINAII